MKGKVEAINIQNKSALRGNLNSSINSLPMKLESEITEVDCVGKNGSFRVEENSSSPIKQAKFSISNIQGVPVSYSDNV